MKQAFIKTYGCQMNEQDSSQMKGILSQAGYESTLDQHEADFILLNTCSIREKAVHKLYSDLGRIRPLTEDHPGLIVGVAGCVAEQEKKKISDRFPFVKLVFGPDHIRHLPEMLKEVEGDAVPTADDEQVRNSVVRTGFEKRQDFQFVNILPEAEENPVKAFVNIQKGCDNICSFCIVPFVRGREVSRPHQEIIDEINTLVDRGVKEVMLLGQNVNSYGLKTTGGVTFAKLLEEVAEKTNLKRLRFTTSHPKDVHEDLIEQYANNPILVPHFHLPVQSGNNRILDLMRRQYTREKFMWIVDELKTKVPKIRFSTDIIVGFPSETEDEFCDTLSLMEAVRFDQVFSFVYSTRPYTKAAKMEDDIPKAVKDERLQRLFALNKKISFEINESEVGTVHEVLVEDLNEDSLHPYPCMGRSANNKIIHFVGQAKPGEIVNVRVTKANPYSLYGETYDSND